MEHVLNFSQCVCSKPYLFWISLIKHSIDKHSSLLFISINDEKCFMRPANCGNLSRQWLLFSQQPNYAQAKEVVLKGTKRKGKVAFQSHPVPTELQNEY
jgi:hypothetical protein